MARKPGTDHSTAQEALQPWFTLSQSCLEPWQRLAGSHGTPLSADSLGPMMQGPLMFWNACMDMQRMMLEQQLDFVAHLISLQGDLIGNHCIPGAYSLTGRE